MNKIYNEDNLLLMESLPKKSIDLIYIDPPFNTGRKGFGYNDSFESTEAFVYWLQFRIVKMRELLKDTGVMCVHLDYRTVHYIKVAMDRIFGEKNFINEIIWKRNFFYNSLGKHFPRNHDHTLAYSKNKNHNYNKQYKKYTKKQLENYRHDDNDGRGAYRLTNLRSASQERLKKENRIVMSKNGTPRMKLFLNNSNGIHFDSIWDDIGGIRNNPEKKNYETQKPLRLLERFIKAFTNEGDLVADFFCGSGTTLVAAKQLGRKYLGCDVSKKAVKITEERLKNAEYQNSSPKGSR